MEGENKYEYEYECVAKNLQLDGSFLKVVSVEAKTCQSSN